MTNRKTLPELLRDYADQNNLTQCVFAEKLGISQPALSYILRAKQFPSLKLIAKISKVTGIDVKEILLADVETKLKRIEGEIK